MDLSKLTMLELLARHQTQVRSQSLDALYGMYKMLSSAAEQLERHLATTRSQLAEVEKQIRAEEEKRQ